VPAPGATGRDRIPRSDLRDPPGAEIPGRHVLELGNEIGTLDGLIDVLFSEIGVHSEVRAELTNPVIFTLRAGRRAAAQLSIENLPEPNAPAVS
jgi:hypothetical protein